MLLLILLDDQQIWGIITSKIVGWPLELRPKKQGKQLDLGECFQSELPHPQTQQSLRQ
jgi:hypothetical protein